MFFYVFVIYYVEREHLGNLSIGGKVLMVISSVNVFWGVGGVELTDLTQVWVQWRAVMITVMNTRVP